MDFTVTQQGVDTWFVGGAIDEPDARQLVLEAQTAGIISPHAFELHHRPYDDEG